MIEEPPPSASTTERIYLSGVLTQNFVFEEAFSSDWWRQTLLRSCTISRDILTALWRALHALHTGAPQCSAEARGAVWASETFSSPCNSFFSVTLFSTHEDCHILDFPLPFCSRGDGMKVMLSYAAYAPSWKHFLICPVDFEVGEFSLCYSITIRCGSLDYWELSENRHLSALCCLMVVACRTCIRHMVTSSWMKYLVTKVTSENYFSNCLSLFYVLALKIQQCIRQVKLLPSYQRVLAELENTNKQAQKMTILVGAWCPWMRRFTVGQKKVKKVSLDKVITECPVRNWVSIDYWQKKT